MLKESKIVDNVLEYKRLTPEEMKARGILGRLVGICADFVNPTRNGRKYSQDLWEKTFSDPIMQERISNGVCYGELGHPADREETDMEKIAVVLSDVPTKGKDGKLRAVFDILDTPNGRILKSLCDYGSTLGISSRGSGDLVTDYEGNESVDPESYSCEGFDVVLIPAVKEARLQYVTESLNKKRYNKTLRESLQKTINEATESEQKIMKETLNTLEISLDEELEKTQTKLESLKTLLSGSYLKEDLESFKTSIMDTMDDVDLSDEEWEDLYKSIAPEIQDEEETFDLEYIKDDTNDYSILKGEFEIEDEQLDEIQAVMDDLKKHYKEVDYRIIDGKSPIIYFSNEEGEPEDILDKEDVEDELNEGLFGIGSAIGTALGNSAANLAGSTISNAVTSGITNALPKAALATGAAVAGGTALGNTISNRKESNQKTEDENLTESSQPKNVIWVKRDGKWFMWGGTNNDEVDDEFLTRASKQNDCTYTDVKVVPNGEDIIDESLNINEGQENLAVENNEALVEELQNLIKQNNDLEEQLISLQEKLSVCYAKEDGLNEKLSKYKKAIVKLTEDAKQVEVLQEQLNNETAQSKQLKEELADTKQKLKVNSQSRQTLKESVNTKSEELVKLQESLNDSNSQILALNEDIAGLKKDLKLSKENYSQKLDASNKLVEKYQSIAKNAVNRYIDSQAVRLGVSTNEIKNKLPESYSFDDIDEICESLQDYKINMSKLPFASLNEDMRVKFKPSQNESIQNVVSNVDDEIDDSLLALSSRFTK